MGRHEYPLFETLRIFPVVVARKSVHHGIRGSQQTQLPESRLPEVKVSDEGIADLHGTRWKLDPVRRIGCRQCRPFFRKPISCMASSTFFARPVGFNLPWWDRLLGTYRHQPRAGHEQMTIGLRQFRDPGRLGLARMLAMPIAGDTGAYSFAPSRRRGPLRETTAAGGS